MAAKNMRIERSSGGVPTSLGRILLIEGEIQDSLKASQILKSAGYEVLSASSGREGVQATRAHRPDLVLLDSVLPDMGGLEVCSQIKSDRQLQKTWVAILSDHETLVEEREDEKAAGQADGFIAKPIDREALLTWVQAMTCFKQAEASLREEQQISGRISKKTGEAFSREASLNAALAGLSNVLLSSRSLSEIGQMILEEARRLTGSAYGFFARRERQKVELAAFTRDPQGQGPAREAFLLKLALWVGVLKETKPLLCNDPAEDPRFSGRAETRIPVPRFLAVPTLIEDVPRGHLVLAGADHNYTEKDLQVAEQMAALFSLAMNRQHNDEDRQAYIRNLEELNQAIFDQNEQIVTIHRIVANLSKARSLQEICGTIISALRDDMELSQAILCLVEEGKGFRHTEVTGLPEISSGALGELLWEDPALQEALKTRRPLFQARFGGTSHLDRLLAHWIIYPVRGKKEILGFLILNDPGPEKRDTLRILINQAQIFVENAALYESLLTVNEQLTRANSQLKDLDRLKSDFLNMVAHDLRTPLTSIRSYADLLLMYKDEPRETQEEFLNTISRESMRLGNLINNFLDLARIEAGTVQCYKTSFPIGELIQHFISVYAGEASRRKISLTSKVEPGLPEAYADRDRLGQVLSNLLSNAVKFTPDGGTIHLVARRTEEAGADTGPEKGKARAKDPAPKGWIEISIADTGPGIDAPYHQTIFNKFVRAEDQATRAKGGTGLGLAIAREILEQHGGRIWVESEKNKGARFIFRIPLSAP